MNITPSEQEIIVKVIDGLITGGIIYVVHVASKVIQNVSSIPDIRKDMDNCFKRIRDLEDKKP